MSTFTKLLYHVIFSTKHRYPSLNLSIQEKLYPYLAGIIRGQNNHLVEIGGIEDHIHLLISLSPTRAVADSIREIKSNSSKWMNEQPDQKCKFYWQKGYGAFTVSYSQERLIRQYIQNQRQHHQVTTFKEEYVKFLELHHISFEPQYLFESEYYG